MNIPKKRKTPRALAIAVISVTAAVLIYLAASNLIMLASSAKHITTNGSAAENKYDCILVLGCGVKADGSPSDMLADRLKQALTLYTAGVSSKIIVSGDHGTADYDEVNTMKNYLIERGVPSSDIFMDHAGFSTYDSLYRARDVFLCKRIIIVTQKYHLYRAVFIANSLGLDADGSSASLREYRGQIMRDAREVAARSKDLLSCLIKPLPKYLGDTIPISGNGDLTND